MLKEISSKIYNLARAKYEYLSLTQSFKWLLSTKQGEEETLIYYTKRFKHSKDNFGAIVGKKILGNFVKNTKQYKEATGARKSEK